MLEESKKVQRRKSVKQTGKSKSNQSLKSTKLLNNTSISIINDVADIDYENEIDITKNLDKLGCNGRNENAIADEIYTQFATLFKNPNTIMIPTKVKSLLKRDLPKSILDKIHGRKKGKENREIAVELCLLFLSQLSSNHRNILNGNSPEGWKSLRAEYLRQLLWIDKKSYQRVIKVLLQFNYKVGVILEREKYEKGKYSYKYRLGESFCSKGFEAYKLQTDLVQQLFKRSCERKLKKAQENIICVNLLEFYKTITLPTESEIQKEADRLIKLGYKNKKGKKLIRRNKKGNSYFTDLTKLSFVEDALKIFRYLTKNGLMIPRPGNEKSGGRVIDSFTLMPGWIRNLVKIDGKPIAEADYSCLHPNIVMVLYRGNSQNLQHTDLCIDLGIDKIIVKKEHLSFFNKEIWQMKQSPLFNYYQKHEPIMMNAIIKEKNMSEYGYKVTSRRLFTKEVEIMTEVILRLNEEGIFVGYVYDALFFNPQYSEKVVETMNEVIAEFSVFTTAKLEHKIA